MPPTLITPLEIEHPLYEGTMEFVGRVDRHGHETQIIKTPGPVVTLGQPQWWNLDVLAQEGGVDLPSATKRLLSDSGHYLLQLACSFRPDRYSSIEWAELSINLRSEQGRGMPITVDLFPREVSKKPRANIQVSITPGLRFSEKPETVIHMPPDQYNIAAVRSLIRAAFTARDLQRFCRDNRLFRPILNHFGPGFALEDMIEALIEQCQVQYLFPELLAEIQIYNPRQYQRFADQLYEGGIGQKETVVTTIEFPRLHPVVFGFGILQSDPGWQFEVYEDQPLRGSRFGYLIVQKPQNSKSIHLDLNISADVHTDQGLVSARLSETDRQHLARIVCND